MLLQLPVFEALLAPCSVSAAAFTNHEKGHFCSSCQRVVQDFSHSENPAVDLAAARAASPDGRVCGSFQRGQVLVPTAPTLSRRLRWFLMSLVLVVGQGLTAREALAQVSKPLPHNMRTVSLPENVPTPLPAVADENSGVVYGAIVELMPSFRGGGQRELVAYIQKHIRWPKAAGRVCAEGRVFASFTIGADGRVHDAHIVKSLDPLLDAEVLRVIRQLTGFKPGRQNGQPVAVSFTVPVSFKLE
ncbi:energy transducer TonB [Hymenobacter negativus]|uniref:Energy transducer TonB n=1 Tax=Hymenobacter negativus TaxID=2795026 RepID=A0ABS3QNL9_9BACT|nr:energy transducer TonB [Hymenobacter negativus]MBO2012280.1 energy transducer TonB [Hymenobacter negativus]